MTTPVSGSSLPQTRDDVDVHQHNHFHNSRDSHHNHLHHTHRVHHHHVRSQNSNKRGRKRTDSDEPTTIVETVSVLQLIDSTGSVLTLQTLSHTKPTPATNYIITTTANPDTGSVSAQGLPTSLPGTSDDDGDGQQSTSIPTIDPTVAPSESSMPTTFPTLSYSPLTSTPLSGNPVFPSLAGVTNTTQASSLFPNTTVSTHSFSAESFSNSSFSIFAGTFSSSSSTPATTTTHSKSTSSSFGSFGVPSATETSDNFVGGDAQPSSASTDTTDDGSKSSEGPGAATVAGSVLGGVAALAFLLILALFLLRWKKRQNTAKLVRGSTSERGPGGVLVGNSGPGGGDGGGMSERRRSIPFAIPAALASLTGYKRFSGRSAASADGGERGFSKISGRKLPPVLQFGGDGYTDPRDTILSDQSIEYRDSTFPGLGNLGPTRLALGVPMRPESGIPVFNPGPARTPITEQGPFKNPNPFADDNSPLEPPPRDPLGRSHPSYDGSSRSHGSASRFTEEL
ncbi:hypothetical protein F5Y04DRAFT_280444 [Hypomontagnella monticulosa]|nr:hypothetical protein F5Y04DRAFT_280444 [Hypomontagnella monticulosa]